MEAQVFVHRERPRPDAIDAIENWNPCEEASGGLYNKPSGGMWTSPVSAEWGWRDWCEQEDYLDENDRTFRLSVEEGVNIYTIDSLDDLLALIDRHERTDLIRRSRHIDFESAFREYDGIHLTERGQRKTRHSSEADLYGWDVECVLWDEWHFTDVSELREVKA